MQRIITLGMTAPNIDNAQPFYFRWDGDRLMIFRDQARDRRRGNEGNYASMVGLGCLVECILIAASGEGFAANLDFLYSEKSRDAPWMAIRFTPASMEPDELLPGLQLRSSDRRAYQGGDLTDPVFEQVALDAQQFQDCRLSFQVSYSQTLMGYLLRCEEFLWQDKKLLPEMLSWVRWSQKEVQETRDGMPWQSLAVGFVTSRLMRLIKKSSFFRQLAIRSGSPLRTQQKTLEANIHSSAALGCIGVKKTDHQTMLQVGRLFVRAWVRLNMSGFGVQVMANPSLHVFQHVIGAIPDDYPAESRRIFAKGEEILKEAFTIPESEVPAWIFRTGKSTPLPAEMKSLRLPLTDVVQSM
ncbi:MAG: hypothetical protein PVI99_00225 [Anaerolineales bacterium]